MNIKRQDKASYFSKFEGLFNRLSRRAFDRVLFALFLMLAGAFVVTAVQINRAKIEFMEQREVDVLLSDWFISAQLLELEFDAFVEANILSDDFEKFVRDFNHDFDELRVSLPPAVESSEIWREIEVYVEEARLAIACVEKFTDQPFVFRYEEPLVRQLCEDLIPTFDESGDRFELIHEAIYEAYGTKQRNYFERANLAQSLVVLLFVVLAALSALRIRRGRRLTDAALSELERQIVQAETSKVALGEARESLEQYRRRTVETANIMRVVEMDMKLKVQENSRTALLRTFMTSLSSITDPEKACLTAFGGSEVGFLCITETGELNHQIYPIDEQMEILSQRLRSVCKENVGGVQWVSFRELSFPTETLMDHSGWEGVTLTFGVQSLDGMELYYTVLVNDPLSFDDLLIDLHQELMLIGVREFDTLYVQRSEAQRALLLQQTEDLSNFANQLATTFNNVSHEIRTPLTSIQGFVELLLESSAENDKTDYAAIIRNNVERVLNIVSQLAAASKSRKVIGDPEAVAVNASVRSAIENLAPITDAKDIHISFNRNIGDTVTVHINPDDWNNIIQSIISNAVKFSSNGSSILITTRSCTDMEEGSSCVEVIIEDEGPGVLESELRHIGTRFYRGSHAIEQEIQGTGLGLAIVKDMFLGPGRSLEFSNRSPHGLRVTFRFGEEQ